MGYLAVVDSNEMLCDTQKFGFDIILPNAISDITDFDAIVVGTANKEVNSQVGLYSNVVITWDNLLTISYGTDEPRTDILVRELNEKNVKNCKVLTNRIHLLKELNKICEKFEIFAEIGVAFGDYSAEIMKNINPNKLLLIDAWEGDRYGSGKAEVEKKFDAQIENSKVQILQGYSEEILSKLDDQSTDVAYIDTGHSYELTFNELILCARKVKNNGYICGHDYVNVSPISRYRYGVSTQTWMHKPKRNL